MLDDTAALLGVVRDRGLLVHDLHPGNLFVSDADGSLKLFDLETLTRRDRPGPPPLIVPDYLAGEGVGGLERDRYARQVLARPARAPPWPDGRIPPAASWVRRWIVDHFGSDTSPASTHTPTPTRRRRPLPWATPRRAPGRALAARPYRDEPPPRRDHGPRSPGAGWPAWRWPSPCTPTSRFRSRSAVVAALLPQVARRDPSKSPASTSYSVIILVGNPSFTFFGMSSARPSP